MIGEMLDGRDREGVGQFWWTIGKYNFFCKIRDGAPCILIEVDLIEDGTRILDPMKIKVVSRRYFKKLKGSLELAAVISSHRIVSIGL